MTRVEIWKRKKKNHKSDSHGMNVCHLQKTFQVTTKKKRNIFGNGKCETVTVQALVMHY